MKRFFQFLAASALVVSMQGCSKDSAIEPTPDSPVQLRLTGEINQTTRVNEAGFEANDAVGVYVSTSGTLNTSGNTLNNEAFTYIDGKLVAPEGEEVYWGSDDVRLSVWAYYPYVEYIEDNSVYEFSVSEDQSAAEDFYNSDFITASATNLPPQDAPVELAFDHALSKIAIALTAGEGTTAEDLGELEKSFTINGVVVNGTIDLSDGTATTGLTVASVTPLASADGLGYSAIVYPQSGNVSFRLEIGEDVYVYSADVDFTAGYQYKYTFKINVRDPQEMTLTSATINPWEEDEDSTEAELSDIITFTDPKFKEFLLQHRLYTDISYDYEKNSINLDGPINVNIDANNDGEISIAEAEKVAYIYANSEGLSDLNELHYFVNLKYLSCTSNKLTTLDVSKNTALIMLHCSDNQLASLDVSNNTELARLVCSSNLLTTLDVSSNTALRFLYCCDNQLTTLDVSKNKVINELFCYENNLTSLDVSNNVELKYLSCWDNQLSTLDISKNTMLEGLECQENQLTSLDVSKNILLAILWCYGNQLTSLDISNNTALTILNCNPMYDAEGNNLLTTIYIAEGQEIETLDKPEETIIEEKE